MPQSSMDVMAQLQNLAQHSQQPEAVQAPQADDTQAIQTFLALLLTHPLIMQKLQDSVGKERAEKFMEELEDMQEEINNEI